MLAETKEKPMKDRILAVLKTMPEKGSSILRMVFKEGPTDSALSLLGLEKTCRVVIEPRMMAALANVSNNNSWEFIPERKLTIQTTGVFEKEVFADLMASSLEHIELLEERRKTPR